MKQTLALTITLISLLVATIAVGAWVWHSIGDTEISGHGWAALLAGVVISLAVGGGLMALVFFSSSHGYDDNAN